MFTVSEGGGYLASQGALSIYVAALKTGCSLIACRNTVRQQWGATMPCACKQAHSAEQSPHEVCGNNSWCV